VTVLDAPRPRSARHDRARTARVAGTATSRRRTTTAARSRAAEVPEARHRTVRQRVGTGVFVALMGTVLLVGLLVMLLVNTSLAQGAFRLSELSRQAADLSQQEQQLAGALALEENPARLEERARGLGMVPQDVPAFLRLSDGTILGTPTPQRAPVIVPVVPLVPESVAPPVPDPGAQAGQQQAADSGLLADRAGTAPADDVDSTAVSPPLTDPTDATADAIPGAEPSRSTWMPWTDPGVAP